MTDTPLPFPHPSSAPAPMRVLVVEDDPVVRFAVQVVLARAGFEVEVAADGCAAVRAFRRRPSNAVVCDLYLPEKNGLEVMAELAGEFGPVPVVAISGGGSDGRVDLLAVAVRLGARAALRKPFAGAELVGAVRGVLGAGTESEANTAITTG
ncbi:response regulator receiver protein : Response regulator receiver protein OS=Desulfovibrio alkalitolerans DSM 16529 GN=dsat_1207 PE=4 SV=1: Response_reg [Gemmataceae bacterium]|nr:response regulator receiver protein : Response regulator receiver protein OS=Desulfovibrio alkalitolerans DSM 16529 GN=dsat_1207 PE=4 SV=1: Response_reg [Gemmataceae bacterium]VTT98977.1 response regulator receiver protein : Response regulator receiver protein OS=Desulfovibrio alkalitolerans DSM 16529 GN=dsat_1207 PE=4 SV=1: Response_reg [Gemmataceae bacterium]